MDKAKHLRFFILSCLGFGFGSYLVSFKQKFDQKCSKMLSNKPQADEKKTDDINEIWRLIFRKSLKDLRCDGMLYKQIEYKILRS